MLAQRETFTINHPAIDFLYFTALFLFFTAPELPIVERRNWLIHQHYIRKDYDSCKVQ